MLKIIILILGGLSLFSGLVMISGTTAATLIILGIWLYVIYDYLAFKERKK